MKRLCLTLVLLAACSRANTESSGQADVDSLSIVAPFSGPESIQYYPKADEYFVANVNGDMTIKDDNGFISRVSPDGHDDCDADRGVAGRIGAPGLGAFPGDGLGHEDGVPST